ncbi:MAG: hypothetical protein WBH99_06605 [Azovibrio sp.]|uniref:hypothetical protein n=1 Tax=Azovibrio sp. TaxID=1872673 RepID=UPI003C74AAD2
MALRFFTPSTTVVLAEPLQTRLRAWQELPAPSLGQAHYQVRYGVLHLHTEGLDPQQHRIKQLAAVGVSHGSIHPDDAFWIEPGSHDPEAWLAWLEFVGKAPLASFQLPFVRAFLEPALRLNLGLEPRFCWLDLAVLLPELFREAGEPGHDLEGWLDYFSLDHGDRRDVMGETLLQARLLQRLLAAARRRGVDSPAALQELARAHRWLHGAS